MSASPLLQLRHVSRALAGRLVVNDLNLDLDRGSVLGLLGVNGAGKSTTLRMIAGVLAPGSGRILIAATDLRENPRAAREKLGYLPEQVPLYGELRVIEYLDFCARLHGLRGGAARNAVNRVVERCGLGEVRRRLLGNLSKGFQQRVGIAQAIVHDPALIVLDEPASGLDPVQAANIRALVRELGREHAVILSTHLLPDVQACCDRVAILHQGRLRRDCPLHALDESGTVRVATTAALDATQWKMVACVESAEPADGAWRIRLAADATPAQLAEAIVGHGWGLRELRAENAGLEEIFLRIASADIAQEAA
ncbi:MAG: ABC transporter ATP-binding protein [Rudaea sp.]|nr:ABC transporter ATP-binding protein [Rudaea sp.]